MRDAAKKCELADVKSLLARGADVNAITSFSQTPIQPIYAIKPTANGDITLAEGKDSNDHIPWSKKSGGTVERLLGITGRG